MRKIAIVSFQGEMSCFVHALLNVWNYHERGYETALIIEGASTRLLSDIPNSPKGELDKTDPTRHCGELDEVCPTRPMAVRTMLVHVFRCSEIVRSVD